MIVNLVKNLIEILSLAVCTLCFYVFNYFINRFRYYCTLGAVVPTPTDGTTGDECPAGNYCNSGSSKPTPCSTGMACTIDGLENPDKQCEAGEFKSSILSLLL